MTDTTKTWPHHELGRKVSNWGRWGPDDEIGTLNYVTDAKRVAAAQLVRSGRAFDLGLPFDKDGPFKDGGFRVNPQHIMTLLPSDTNTPDNLISADDMVVMGLQAATQWDSLAHIGYDGFFYNNVPAAAVNSFVGAARNSFAKSVKNLITRGVLLDIAALKGVDRLESSYEITAQDLSDAEERQGVRVESGDVLLLRTGWVAWFHEGDRKNFLGKEPGPGLDAVPWLHTREIAALATDNHACEVMPSAVEGVGVPFHQVVIRDMGLLVGEMFDFEELATDCAQDGVWEFLFNGTGLKVTGSVGSPITPIALK
ncbi:kynurenine formamidase [Prauserella sediminis]|uniref:Kynurenine formamidase n=1 Tax=Prauserella sediminis TaxID=577680 RepID=A0A839XSA3_9PSEU|nr:cyclase family protein [Prauserella sediminis]MBB3665611.1 kynurenine formamidase [Prauserella sediminis]